MGLRVSRPKLEEAQRGRFLESSAPSVIASGLIEEPDAQAEPSLGQLCWRMAEEEVQEEERSRGRLGEETGCAFPGVS